MNWELLGPFLVVLFELLIFVGTVAFVAYGARQHDQEPELSEEMQPVAGEPSHVPPHAA